MSATDFQLSTDFITLGQLAKATGVVGSGSDIKQLLADNPATVNGETENRRGRKLYPGDVVQFRGQPTIRLR